MLFQIFLIGFAVWLIGRVSRQYSLRKIQLSWFLLWTIFSVGIIVVALQPGLTDRLAGLVGVGRGADLVIYVSLLLLFVAIFRHASHLHRLERDLTDLVRSLALRDAKDENFNHEDSPSDSGLSAAAGRNWSDRS